MYQQYHFYSSHRLSAQVGHPWGGYLRHSIKEQINLGSICMTGWKDCMYINKPGRLSWFPSLCISFSCGFQVVWTEGHSSLSFHPYSSLHCHTQTMHITTTWFNCTSLTVSLEGAGFSSSFHFVCAL